MKPGQDHAEADETQCRPRRRALLLDPEGHVDGCEYLSQHADQSANEKRPPEVLPGVVDRCHLLHIFSVLFLIDLHKFLHVYFQIERS